MLGRQQMRNQIEVTRSLKVSDMTLPCQPNLQHNCIWYISYNKYYPTTSSADQMEERRSRQEKRIQVDDLDPLPSAGFFRQLFHAS